jgi:tRNA-2-methylthio-N6-dimethylallyladenosine synthase
MQNNKYYIETYGCQMNIHESEKIAGVLQSLNFSPCEKMEDAGVIVFNTCCIRESVETKISGNIGAVKPLKKKNKDIIVIVVGCMTQQKTSADILKKKFPWIDVIIGTYNEDHLKDYLQKVIDEKQKIYLHQEKEEKIIENGIIPFRTSGYNAWVNISYGCNKFCTYCIVPYVMGRERSRESLAIINDVKNLVAQGYKQITLLGQTVNSYGKDKDAEMSFAELCDNICKIEGEFKVKFLSSHPVDFDDDLIDIIAKHPKMSKCIHLPVQSGSNNILKSMNRKYTIEEYLSIIKKLRAKVPDICLTTDIIVGFPGETDEDFDDTIALIKKVKYNSIFAFMYSKRRGTVAEKMENQIPIAIKRQRINKLLAIQREISNKILKSYVGKTFSAILTKNPKGVYEAITDCGKPVIIDNVGFHTEFTYCTIKVTDMKRTKLYGQII